MERDDGVVVEEEQAGVKEYSSVDLGPVHIDGMQQL
jgi:hypothetical protein